MRRLGIVGGTLGLGTALVFGAAAIASALFPNGATVPMGWSGGWERGIAVPAPMPVPGVQPGGAWNVGPDGMWTEVKGDVQGEIRAVEEDAAAP